MTNEYHEQADGYTPPQKKIAVFPGSFDPVHRGHVAVLESASYLFDEVVWLIADNPDKKPTFSYQKRLQMMNVVVDHRRLKNVLITRTDGFVVDKCDDIRADFIIRSCRNVTDFEYEMQLAGINQKLAPHIETIFLPSIDTLVSSGAVRALIKARKLSNLLDFLPPEVFNFLEMQNWQ